MSTSKNTKNENTENNEEETNPDFTEQKSSDTSFNVDDKEKETDELTEIVIENNDNNDKPDTEVIPIDVDTIVVDKSTVLDAKELQNRFMCENLTRRKYTVYGLFDKYFGSRLTPEQQQQREIQLQQQREMEQRQEFQRQQLTQQQQWEQQQLRLQQMQQQQGIQQQWQQQQMQQPLSGYPGQTGQQSGPQDNQQEQTMWGQSPGTQEPFIVGAPLVYDPATRNYFIKKVMAIVLCMLVCTAGFLAVVLSIEEAKEFFAISGWIIVLPAMLGLLMCNYAMSCCQVARRPPLSFVVLFVTAVCMSVICAMITSHYRTEIVLYGAIATAAVVMVCLLLAFSKFDFTSWMLYVVVIGAAFSTVALIVLVVMMITGTVMKPILIVILAVGAVLQSVMLTIQLQMVLGGKSIDIGEDDYSIAAYMIYTSIITLFLYLVQILGLAR